MLSVETALRLRGAGLRWEPERGDRFVLPHRDMDADVFVLADMTVDVHEFPTGRVLGFNGTTEWALDSVEEGEALWLPREEQLRQRLGGAFRRMEALPDRRWSVVVEVSGADRASVHEDCEEAYAGALLALAGADEDAGAEPPRG